MCCDEHRVYVAEVLSSYINVYSWGGQHIQRLDLDLDGDMIWGVTYMDNEQTLMAAVGRWDDVDVHSLHAMKVS